MCASIYISVCSGYYSTFVGCYRTHKFCYYAQLAQVGKKLSELIRDSGSQMPGTEQGRWQAELSQAAIELIAVSIYIFVSNCLGQF